MAINAPSFALISAILVMKSLVSFRYMIYVVLQAVLKSDLYIRLTHNFHYRNPLLLVCPVGFSPLPATLFYLYVFLVINTFYVVQGLPDISNKIAVLHQ